MTGSGGAGGVGGRERETQHSWPWTHTAPPGALGRRPLLQEGRPAAPLSPGADTLRRLRRLGSERNSGGESGWTETQGPRLFPALRARAPPCAAPEDSAHPASPPPRGGGRRRSARQPWAQSCPLVVCDIAPNRRRLRRPTIEKKNGSALVCMWTGMARSS